MKKIMMWALALGLLVGATAFAAEQCCGDPDCCASGCCDTCC
jgi:hypothetical protein